LQQAIKGAKLIEIEGGDSFFSHDRAEEVLGYIEEFLTGTRAQTYAERVLATVLFVDIAGSTRLAAKIGDSAWRDLAARFHAMVRTQLHRFRGREIDAAGDGAFATFDSPTQAIRAAAAIRAEALTLGVSVRAGMHTGECEVADGVVRGLAVHIGARVMGEAERDEILVSNTVKDLVAGSDFEFKDRGKHQLKGVPGVWRLHALDRIEAGR
ncbi:MAG TPA: adenylate/guanylate cyclase domain-containing protein, partial [Nevskiaceae bacterium]|nr:adenylate/guanylate cyclase domain-containing protein [Nevskiaceae bacterium]